MKDEEEIAQKIKIMKRIVKAIRNETIRSIREDFKKVVERKEEEIRKGGSAFKIFI